MIGTLLRTQIWSFLKTRFARFFRHYGKNIVVHILPKRMRRHLQTERCPASWLIGSPYWLTAEYLYQTIKQKLPSPNAVTVVTAGRSYYGYAGYETQQRWCRLNVKNSRQDVTYHVIYSHAGWRKNWVWTPITSKNHSKSTHIFKY